MAVISSPFPLLVWSARQLLKRPGESFLLALALATLAGVMATALLLTQALVHTASLLLESGPSLVVRRLHHGGFAPLDGAEALSCALAVPGVTRAEARLWGVVAGPRGPVTALAREGDRALPVGQVIAGEGVPDQEDELTLQGEDVLRLRINKIIDLSLAGHDLAMVSPADARRLLGLGDGQVSDMAVWVFHEGEAEALAPDLAAAFPWPVTITTRREAMGQYASALSHRGGIAIVLLVPALLALTLLIAFSLRQRFSRRGEVGLLKALGWTTGDIVRLHLFESLLTALPAVALGLGLAYGLVFWPGVSWPGSWVLGWRSKPPGLSLHPGGAMLVMVQVGALVLVPWLAAALLPALRGATADPEGMMRGGDR